ncbi:hypothetical protein [Pseudooceanicola sp. 200-1SW]|uniref:hypothetical protein n=1 Tax=Pseudooceanicola sp. 200-1SW TaxID=3425949 RepID=UPI003D7FC921
MEISDIIPKDGVPQQIYCSNCNAHTELSFFDFDETVSGVAIKICGLPVLRCPQCGHEQLPDGSRFAIVNLHKEAFERSSKVVRVNRRKHTEKFGFTNVPFIFDPDDYFYIPGLYRSFDEGFLQPVFFNRSVLLKYDNSPDYSVKFASTTYGSIDTQEDSISFGLNRHGHVVMWLGDIAKLPEKEQFYLRSENIPSDHSLGSEFYDGQIEAVFTELAKEEVLFRLRSEFLSKSLARFGVALGHLEAEAYDLALSFTPPVVDTPKERRHVADTLNKVYLESLDNAALNGVVKSLGVKSPGPGSLKRLQTIMETMASNKEVAALMSPLYVLYDLRVAYSHLAPGSNPPQLESVTRRLGLEPDASLFDIYEKLIDGLSNTFSRMSEILENAGEYKAVPH